MRMIRNSLIFLIFFVSCTRAAPPVASNSYVWNLKSDRFAVQGYDVVAYFSLKKDQNAVKGKKEFSYEWEKAIWLFSSDKNLNLFKSDPAKYIPQFGGYCAYAAARNYLYAIDPHAWTIKDQKLYLNASKGVRSSWLKNIDRDIRKGHKNWPTLKHGKK